ncbi:MAG: PQQ-binding-like beta-propeller repeat protein [Verrucomicrobiales bacterium]|nr:PQQ-binding-like beta-propeller repeat protein [Verrucomicrobiales bacterium]
MVAVRFIASVFPWIGIAVLGLRPFEVRAASEWPMFRGNPQLTGVTSASLPDKPALKWTFKTGGPVKSSAAILGDRVFIGSSDSNLYCLQRSDGRKLWSFQSDGPIEGSPLVLDGRVYFGTANTNVYALDADSGKALWSFGLEDKILSSPNWVQSTITNRKDVLVGGYDFKLYSLGAATGRTNWVFETGNYINGTPAIGDGVTAFGGCDAVVHVVDVLNGKKQKEIEAGAYIAASGALVDQRLYVGHYENAFICVDLKDGRIAWTYKDRAFPYFSSPAVTTDRVIVGGRDKRLHCIKRSNGEPVWVFATRGKVDSSPVVAGDRILVGSDDGRIYMVSLTDGRELWNYEIGQPVQSSPAVVDGAFVIGSDDGSVYCFGSR